MRTLTILLIALTAISCTKEEAELYADHKGYEQSINPEVSFVIHTESEANWTLNHADEVIRYGHDSELSFRGDKGEGYTLNVEVVEPALIRIEYYVNGRLHSSRSNSCEMVAYSMSVQL